MIESIEKVKLEDKFISKKKDVNPAIHDIIIKRKAKDPDAEIAEDKELLPKQKRDKYEQRFSFTTEDLVTRVWNLLHELEQIDVPVFLGKGFGSDLLVQAADNMTLHNEFNRFETKQVSEIVQWCYEI